MEPQRMPTEDALRRWRHGQTSAERLGAQILQLEGFTGIDPQAPIGGPDGTKDILCERNGVRYVAACYFPPTEPRFRDVRKKFEDDLAGAVALGRSGFVFLTGQFLSLGEREKLMGLARAKGLTCELFHGERLRVILDSPPGLGARTEYLRILPTTEELLAGFTQLFASAGRLPTSAPAAEPEAFEELRATKDFELTYLTERLAAVPPEKRHYLGDGFMFGPSTAFLKALTPEEFGEIYKSTIAAVLGNVNVVLNVGSRNANSLVPACSRECGDPGPGPAFKMCVAQVLVFEVLAKVCACLMKPGLGLRQPLAAYAKMPLLERVEVHVVEMRRIFFSQMPDGEALEGELRANLRLHESIIERYARDAADFVPDDLIFFLDSRTWSEDRRLAERWRQTMAELGWTKAKEAADGTSEPSPAAT